MQVPLQITFRNLDPSPTVETKVRERVKELEQFYNRITSRPPARQAPGRGARGALCHR
jgi:hypothetical protein